ncbi:MAG TPA: SDR family NAD(P)-dependent oxidoreductase [Ilumatobacteraceae bacterium]|nr:SDR family NAD(P)-dependent oxidoreductase [Ilumatobacteraceae bacterium]
MSDSQTDSTRPAAIAPGHVAVITGGASGIGLAVAEAMIAEGMSVVLADIDAPKLRDVEARLSEDGASVATMICNTTAEPEVNALVEYALEQFGGIHVMFNNAGIGGVGDAWGDSMELWRRVVDVNLFGVVHGIRAVLPIMQQQGVGHIVNTASMAGLGVAPGIAPYFATKHAVVGLSESLFLELLALGSPVSASVLCPGFVKTDLMDKEPDTVDAPMAQLINQFLRTGVETGIPATDVAEQVVAAVKANQFWILTHPDMRQGPVERMQRAATGVNPDLNLGS